jgi:tellurite resistance protein TerC
MRLVFILAGGTILKHFEWIMPIFGAFLIYTGIKLLKKEDDDFHPDQNILMRWSRKVFNVTKEAHGDHFLARENGKLCVTPLFLVLLVIESTDLLFAVDSVPAIFGVIHPDETNSMFLVFTSNIFAIMGLRALYFLLAGVMDMFRYLNYGLSAVLIFVGGKMGLEYFAKTDLCEKWTGWKLHELPDGGHEKLISPFVSLAIVISLLAVSIIASLIAAKREGPNVPGAHPPEEPGLTPPPPVPDNAEPVLPPDPSVDEPSKS